MDWVEATAYINTGTSVEAHISPGVATVKIRTGDGIINIVCVSTADEHGDPATVLHDLLTSAALEVEKAAAVRDQAPYRPIVAPALIEANSTAPVESVNCACPDKSAHAPWCWVAQQKAVNDAEARIIKDTPPGGWNIGMGGQPLTRNGEVGTCQRCGLTQRTLMGGICGTCADDLRDQALADALAQ